MVAVSYHIKQSFTISEWGSYFPIEPLSKAPKLEIKYPGTDSAGPKKHWMTRRFRVVYTYYYSSPGGTHGQNFKYVVLGITIQALIFSTHFLQCSKHILDFIDSAF